MPPPPPPPPPQPPHPPPPPQHPNVYNWTEARLNEFVGYISDKGVTQLDVWDISAEVNCTEPWVFSIAEKFLAGKLKTDDAALGTTH